MIGNDCTATAGAGHAASSGWTPESRAMIVVAATFKGASVSPSRKSDEDSELKGWKDAAEEEEEEEMNFCHESVRKKMGVLAKLVGMEGCGGQPAVVLTEVVRVLKELDGQARVVCGSAKPSDTSPCGL
ncbi:hypothetical protein IEQ34_008163 [Dendrobium chrysotoxum]|uniref:Uncharacterized protein n=1 Tax=Dendrobium chrysotoxum TaxID=161865 RepID=A0AAV7H506_DENCH|nr:hypothetical protein IEQ34_008163 [Dendrobium chrysotoxum]